MAARSTTAQPGSQGLSTNRLRSASPALTAARSNAAKLLAFLYLQDVFWLIASRINLNYRNPVYQILPFDWVTFAVFFVYAAGLSLIGWVLLQFIRPLPKLAVGRMELNGWLLLGVLANLMFLTYVASGARYTSGGLTGTAGVIYGVARGLTLSGMILAIRMKVNGWPVSFGLLAALFGSFTLTIDGFASALFGVMFLVIYLSLQIKGARLAAVWVFVAVASVGIGYLGLLAKYGGIPPWFLTTDTLYLWAVPRFSVQAESMYSFLAGGLQIESGWDTLDLIMRAISDRIDLVTGQPFQIEYPRSVSESIYSDVFGGFGAGSSPGALLGSAMFGPLLLWLMPMVFGFLFLQLFYNAPIRLSFVRICAFSFLLKGLHADSSEYFTVVSPTLVYVCLFLIGCLMWPKQYLAATPARTER